MAGWSVLVGGYSEIIFEGVSSDLELVEKALKSPKYKELNENLYVDLDSAGKVISLTIEHAKASSGKLDFSYETIAA